MMDPLMEPQTALLLLASILMVGLASAVCCVFVMFLINRRYYVALTLMTICSLVALVFEVGRFLLNY